MNFCYKTAGDGNIHNFLLLEIKINCFFCGAMNVGQKNENFSVEWRKSWNTFLTRPKNNRNNNEKL